MSIEKKQPSKEFYSELDEVINHQIKSREAFNRAIEIARKQGFGDLEIGLFVKDYLKDKIPKTSLYRYLGELENLKVPLGQIYYNNVLGHSEIKDPEYHRLLDEATEARSREKQGLIAAAKTLEHSEIEDQEYKQLLDEVTEAMSSEQQELLAAAKRLEKLGTPKEKIAGLIVRHFKERYPVLEDFELDFTYGLLPSEYKDPIHNTYYDISCQWYEVKEQESIYENIRQIAEGYKKLHELGAYKDPINTICTTICMEGHKKLGWDEKDYDYVRSVLADEYKT